MYRVLAVSYTHLDVYKRQMQRYAADAIREKSAGESTARNWQKE